MPGAAPQHGHLWLSSIAINLLVAMTVVEAVQQLDQNLFECVVATLAVSPSAGNETIVFWSRALAVRVQMAQLTLVAAKESAAELLGRVLDASLESRADGQPFKHWATLLLTSCVYEAPTALDRRSTTPGAFAVGFEKPESQLLERDALFYRVQIRQRGGKWRPTDDRLRLCLSERLCALMARVLVLCASIFLSATEAAGATQKSDIQEWPFPAVSESCSRPCTLAGVRPQAVPRWPCGRTSGCVRRCDFSVVSTQKSIDTRHHSPPLCGGRASGRRGHNAGSGRPRPRGKK